MSKFYYWFMKTFRNKEEWQIKGWVSKLAYERNMDSGIFYRANRVKDYYPGYPFIVKCMNFESKIYQHWAECVTRVDSKFYDIVNEWAKQHCEGKHRIDFHSVSRRANYGSNEEDDMDYCFGREYIYGAFTSEKDAMFFALAWA